MKLIVFEDQTYENIFPLTYLRPIFELRCGATTLLEKIVHAAGADSAACFVRDWMAESYAEKTDSPVNDLDQLEGDVLLVNGGLLVDGAVDLSGLGEDQAVTAGEALVAARVSADTLAEARDGASGENAAETFEAVLAALCEKLSADEAETTMIDAPWLLIRHNAAMLEKDFERLYADRAGVHGDLHETSCVVGDPDRLYVAETAEVGPMVPIDVTGGPVVLEDGVKVLPHTRIEGPAYVGPDCQLHGGKMREGCSFGPACRVGGEVECSIMQGYSNKYHDGYLGHSYLGEWVNLGAMTTNSDLKNDYTGVSVYFKDELVDTGERFLGSFIGDHTKTSIGTLLNTGTIIGVMSNLVFNGALMPKEVPSFCWMINDRPTRGLGFKNMLFTARAAMKRRGQDFSPADERLLAHVRNMVKPKLREAIRKAFKR